MKHTFTTDSIGHAWIHQTEDTYGSAGNVFFEDDVIYSYGRHFPIARKNVLPGVHLFTSNDYSVSTASHKSKVWSSMHGNGKMFTVPDVMANSKTAHKANYQAVLPNIQDSLAKAVRARTYQDMHLRDAHKTAEMLNEYSKTFKLGYRAITLPEDLVDVANAVKRHTAAERKRNAARLAKQQRDNADKIQAWIDGDTSIRLPSMTKVYMRVIDDTVYTSQAASFPVDHARRVFKTIKRCKDTSTGWKRNGETLPVGHFQIDAIRSNGTVVAGCHTIQYDEIERIAAIINAPSE